MIKKLILASVFASCLAAIPAVAQEGGAVDIEAGQMEILESDKRAIFTGDVIAKRTNETIRADKMEVTYVEVKQPDGTSKTEVDKLVCTGGISITTATQKITGTTATFYVLKDELVVVGNVKVVQGKTTLRGPELVVNLKTRKTVMKGGRVKGTLVPN
jgi:lipopolysaccharide export system protein LptA